MTEKSLAEAHVRRFGRVWKGILGLNLGMLPIMGTTCDCLWEIVRVKQSAGGHGGGGAWRAGALTEGEAVLREVPL